MVVYTVNKVAYRSIILQYLVVYEMGSTTSCLYVEDNTNLLLYKQGKVP